MMTSEGSPNSFLHSYRLLLLGDSGAGKTSMVMRYCEGSFTESFIQTIGIDFKVKTVLIHNQEVKLQIWDTAGQERFRGITTSYFRNCDAVIIVFDLSVPKSINTSISWIDTLEEHVKNNDHSDPFRFIVGNKCDLVDPVDRMSRTHHALDLIKYLDEDDQIADQQPKIDNEHHRMTQYFEVSAKTGENIDDLFERVAEIIYVKKLSEPEKDKSKNSSFRVNDFAVGSQQNRRNNRKCCI